MRLYVMRHGPALDHAPSGRDFDRPLSNDGRQIVERTAWALRALRSELDLPRVLASPLLRAQQTAELVCAVAASPTTTVETRDELAVDEPPPLRLAAELAAGADTLIVGHQPAVEALVRSLCRGGIPDLASGFRTATIVCLARDGGAWRAEHVLAPS